MGGKLRRLFEKKTTRIVAAAFLLICALIAVVMFGYYNRLRETVTNESSAYMQEISSQIGANVSRTIDDNFSVLSTVSTVLKSGEVDTYEKLQPVIREQQTYWGYKNIYLIDESGSARDAYGATVNLAGAEYLRRAVVDRERAMSTAQVIDGEECIVFIVPVDGMSFAGENFVALAANYEISAFEKILDLSAFGGQGYCSLNQRDGSVVVRSGNAANASDSYNTFATLEASAQMDQGDSVDDVRADLAAGRSGMVGFTREDIHTYMAYTPLELGEWCLLTFVPVAVVNARSQALMELTLAMCGLIVLVFALLLGALLWVSYRHRRRLEQIAYVDAVTGGDTIQRFYLRAEELLSAPGRGGYALIYINVEKFKVLNEQFGRAACDELLRSLWQGAYRDLTDQECAGHITADNFCALVLWEGWEAFSKRTQRWYAMASARHREVGAIWMEPIMGVGVYPIGEGHMPFDHMIDRAKLALHSTAQELCGHIRGAVYDDGIRRHLFREKQLEDMMEKALREREFLVYLQPKYEMKHETIGGAEALVRWKNPSEGMIYPDEFIPLFEKNGFIVQLDLYVFEGVCRAIRRWLDAELTPVKVSVNCSRVNLKIPNFLDRYRAICARWDVPPAYIELELTESMVFEDGERLAGIIEEIHAAGFACAMDDFGSGYSSLNMIQEIHVDTIKLDRIFFRTGDRKPERTESVVGCVLAMGKALNTIMVAEGVEERGQVDMLRRLGCDYIQGYYYAKPMPISEFECAAFGRAVEEAMV